MAKTRIYRDFTEIELKIIADSNEKLNKADLAKKLNISYTNFTAMLKQKKVYFKPAKHFTASKVKKESPDMTKTHNEKGQLILTDKLMKKEYCIMQEA